MILEKRLRPRKDLVILKSNQLTMTFQKSTTNSFVMNKMLLKSITTGQINNNMDKYQQRNTIINYLKSMQLLILLFINQEKSDVAGEQSHRCQVLSARRYVHKRNVKPQQSKHIRQISHIFKKDKKKMLQ